MTPLTLVDPTPAQPLTNGWQQRQWRLMPSIRLQPGQWLTFPTAPHVFPFAQPAPDRLILFHPPEESEPLPLKAQLAGQPRALPEQALIVAHGLTGLGAALLALRSSGWRRARPRCLLLNLESGTPASLPFRPAPSRFWLPDLPDEMIATLPLVEDWGIPARLIHPALPGCWSESWSTLQAQLPEAWPVIEVGHGEEH